MTARVFVHPAALLATHCHTLADTLARHEITDALIFDHPPATVHGLWGSKRAVIRHELVRMIRVEPRTYVRMDGVEFEAGAA